MVEPRDVERCAPSIALGVIGQDDRASGLDSRQSENRELSPSRARARYDRVHDLLSQA